MRPCPRMRQSARARGLPAAWISGALVVSIALAVAGVRIAVPEWIRFLAFIVLGTSMGTALTPETFARAATWPVSMACLGASVLATSASADGRRCCEAGSPRGSG